MDMNMGNLKPDTKYIYERVNGHIYAREFGADPSTKIEIGYDWNGLTSTEVKFRDQLLENQLWDKIRKTAKSNSVLQAELDRVIVLYHLLTEQADKTI
jgi:hypothetical protein